MKLKRINYVFFAGFVVFKMIDILLTLYGLSLGGIELNPIGFNVISISVNVMLMISLGLFIFLDEDKIVLSSLLISLIVLNGFYIYVTIHNLCQVINYNIPI